MVILQEFPGSVERCSQRERFGQAKYDFERYLELAPDADDSAAIREQLVEIAEQVVLIH